MPDFGTSPKSSKYIELFDNTLKLGANSPYTQEFDLAGARGFILHQQSTHVSSPARTKVSSQNWSDSTGPIDDDLNTATAHVYCVAGFSGGSPQQAIWIIDFGSIATRDISTKARASMSCNSSGSGSRNVQVNVQFSTDNVSYSGGGQVVNANGAQSGGQDNTSTRTDLGVNMRYAKVYTSGAGGGVCNGNCSVFECWVPGQSLGTGNLTFELFNELTQAWETLSLGLTPTQVNSDSGTTVTQHYGLNDGNRLNLPTGAGRMRAKYTITDGCDAKAGIVLLY
jgi:hypothetical protein